MTSVTRKVDPFTGQLYGELVHPMSRSIADSGIEMVCDTHRSQLIEFGFNLDRLSELSVLECGGTGRDALAWQRLGVKHVTHVDLAEANVARVRAYCRETGITNVTSIHADLMSVDLPSKQFDIVRSRGVWHHLPDPALALAHYARWAREGGFLHLNAYRGGTFFYYGVKLFRQLAPLIPVQLIVETMHEERVPEGRASILLDNFYVPFMHTASQSVLEADFMRAGLSILWPKLRPWPLLDHDIRYPDMPEKTQHIQYWLRKDRHFEDAPALANKLAYHEGVDDVGVAEPIPERSLSLESFRRLVELAKTMPGSAKLASVAARLYIEFHYNVSIGTFAAAERHRRFAALINRGILELKA